MSPEGDVSIGHGILIQPANRRELQLGWRRGGDHACYLSALLSSFIPNLLPLPPLSITFFYFPSSSSLILFPTLFSYFFCTTFIFLFVVAFLLPPLPLPHNFILCLSLSSISSSSSSSSSLPLSPPPPPPLSFPFYFSLPSFPPPPPPPFLISSSFLFQHPTATRRAGSG